MVKKIKQNRKTVWFLLVLVLILTCLLVITNWREGKYLWHHIEWKLGLQNNPEFIEQLIKEKIRADFRNMATENPEEWQKIKNMEKQIIVYFKIETPKEEIYKITNLLLNNDKVAKLNYISQEEAYKIYLEKNKDDSLLSEVVKPDIFPASLEIQVKEVNYISDIILLFDQFKDDIDTLVSGNEEYKRVQEFMKGDFELFP